MSNIVATPIVGEVEQSFLDYSLSVITDRAIPAVEDGLKPVMRRILWAMMEDGNTSNKQYVKCASPVGTTMSRYHAHGDSSIYGALVYASQPWSMRYPLIDFHGNNGSRDNDGPASMRYCITGGSLIDTNKGLIPIKELEKYCDQDGNFNEQILIKNYLGNYVPTDKFFNSGLHPVKEIALKNGQNITATGNHPLMVLNDELDFSWKTVDQLKVGDKILLPHYNYNIEINNDGEVWAKALGALVSEGYLTTQNRVGISNTDLCLINPVKEWFSSLDDKLTARINENARGYYEYCVGSKKIQNILIGDYQYQEKANNKIIPDLIMASSIENISAFLRYLFEGDGSAVVDNKCIYYSTYSEKLVHQIQSILLMKFNIFSYISSSRRKTGVEYKLIIAGEDVKKYKRYIGFVSDRKQQALDTICQMGLNARISNNSYYNLHEVSSYIRKLNHCKFTEKHSFANTKNYYLCRDYIDPLNYERLYNLIKNYLYIPIAKISEKEEAVVYSIRVSDKESDHSFIANGFINHNTECRLGTIAEATLEDIKKDTVDWMSNYSETGQEPVYLPGRFPTLMCNGSVGIAVGMACHFAPHNLTEVMSAAIHCLQNPDATTDEILEYIQGPDFPTGGTVINKDNLKSIYKTGKGSIKLRGDYHIEDARGGKQTLVFDSIPYKVSKETLMEEIDKLCEEKKLDGITEIRDETNKQGVRFVIELAKGVNGDAVANKLYSLTDLEISFSVNQVALVDKTPRLLTFPQLIKKYVERQEEVFLRKNNFELQKLQNRIHILNGLATAAENIDNVIRLIKTSENATAASVNLQKQYGLDEIQAKAILDMRLSKLARTEKIAIDNELQEKKKEEQHCLLLINDRGKRVEALVEELRKFTKTFGDERRTKIAQINVTKEEKEVVVIKPENCVVVITESGSIKRVPSASYKTQKRNTKGVKNKDEIIQQVIKTNTVDSLLVFTSHNKLYHLDVNDIPSTTNAAKGVGIETLIGMEPTEKFITAASAAKSESDKQYVWFITANGLIKKTSLSEYGTTGKRKVGKVATGLREDDSLAKMFIGPDAQIMIFTKNGMSVRFDGKSIGVSSRIAKGIKGIGLSDGDKVIDAISITPEDTQIAVFTKNGYGKRVPLTEFPLQNRGGKGVYCYKGGIIAACTVKSDNAILVSGDLSSLCVMASDIPELSRASQGNVIIKDNNIMGITKI